MRILPPSSRATYGNCTGTDGSMTGASVQNTSPSLLRKESFSIMCPSNKKTLVIDILYHMSNNVYMGIQENLGRVVWGYRHIGP